MLSATQNQEVEDLRTKQMNYTENAINLLTAKSYKGIGNAWLVRNLKGNESVDAIVSLLNSKIENKISVQEFENLKREFETKLTQKFENCCDGFVALCDNKFPQHRGTVKESERPVFLYYKGNIDLLSIENRNISVIGLLNPQGNIEERERRIVAEFVKNGATIVSGLAFGCDSISHKQAIDSHGKTVAILPSPLNNILPARNRELAYQIIEEGGLLVTEYGNDFKSQMELRTRYKERDRLQALFCDTIVLAASYAQNSAERWEIFGQKLDSGARLAMGFAKEYNIPRAVMYDAHFDENDPMFDLNRDIINEQRDVTIITQDNFTETVAKVIRKESTLKNTIAIQKKLFD